MRILVAEDDPGNQELMVEALELLGHQAEVASNGLDVVKLAHQEVYGLIFMDCGLPFLSGVDAVSRLRASGAQCQSAGVPIIALTGDVSRSKRDECLESGMNDVLTKPVSLEDLERVIHRWEGEVA